MENLFFQLATVLVLASVFGIIARLLKQPLIVAYIFTGIVISIFAVFKSFDKTFLDVLANFGIAFLLFLVGVELKIEDLKYVGKAAILTGLGQIFFTAFVGFVIISALGFAPVPAIYIATALTFSSTVIIVKLLSEKHDLQSLYGKIAVGFLLVQDFVAILALMVLSGFGQGRVPSFGGIIIVFVKGALLVVLAYLLTKFVLKLIFKMASVSTELLFVAAIAWALFFSAVAEQAGFSIAIGAFLAGVAIASSPFRIQISARVKPLRDFFIIIFFILLGASFSGITSNINFSQIILISLFIIIGNPLIVITVMMTLGFRNRTSFLSSISTAQISEFSLILMTVGRSLGHVSDSDVALVAAIGIVTITLSSYLILYGDRIYRLIQKPMAFVFPEKTRDPYVLHKEDLKEHIILVGAEQIGWDILNYLKGKAEKKEQIVFGDITDPEVLEELEISRAKLIVITDPDPEDCIHLIKFAKHKNFKGPILATSYWVHDAIRLYEEGCDYVVVPEAIGGKHLSRFIAEHWEDLNKIKKEKSKHFEELVSKRIF